MPWRWASQPQRIPTRILTVQLHPEQLSAGAAEAAVQFFLTFAKQSTLVESVQVTGGGEAGGYINVQMVSFHAQALWAEIHWCLVSGATAIKGLARGQSATFSSGLIIVCQGTSAGTITCFCTITTRHTACQRTRPEDFRALWQPFLMGASSHPQIGDCRAVPC